MNILPGSGRKWKSLEPKEDEYTCVITSRPIPKNQMAMSKEYLGDSVYIEPNEHGYKLTTDNGMGPTNTIYLEWELVGVFFSFVKRNNPELWEALKNGLR